MRLQPTRKGNEGVFDVTAGEEQEAGEPWGGLRFRKWNYHKSRDPEVVGSLVIVHGPEDDKLCVGVEISLKPGKGSIRSREILHDQQYNIQFDGRSSKYLMQDMNESEAYEEEERQLRIRVQRLRRRMRNE